MEDDKIAALFYVIFEALHAHDPRRSELRAQMLRTLAKLLTEYEDGLPEILEELIGYTIQSYQN